MSIDADHWTELANCRGMNLEDFYIGTTDDKGWHASRNTAHLAGLRTICRACPVRDQCLEDAIDTFDRHAFRGGMTPPERRRHARKAAAS